MGNSYELSTHICNNYSESIVLLYGLWKAELQAEGTSGTPTQTATLLFEKHPELPGSVTGGINRGGQISQAAGDLDAGSFTLEESPDGKIIAAVWDGELEPSSCGKTIKGSWTNQLTGQVLQFVLRKVPGWN